MSDDPSVAPSLRASILRMVAMAFPQLVYGYPRTYVTRGESTDGVVDLVAPPDATHLAPLRRVPVNPSAWVTERIPDGTEVVVSFADSDPGRARVVEVHLAGTPTLAAARTTDAIEAGELYFVENSGVSSLYRRATGGSWTLVTTGATPPIPSASGTSVTGTIAGGSGNVRIG